MPVCCFLLQGLFGQNLLSTSKLLEFNITDLERVVRGAVAR